MIAAKEKAIELIKKFYKATYKDNRAYRFEDAIIIESRRRFENKNGLESIGRAKECALVLVEEILKSNPQFHTQKDQREFFEYWNEVKKEIETDSWNTL